MSDVQPSAATSLQLEILQQLSALSIALGNLQGQANIIIREQERAAEGRRQMYEKLSRIDTLSQTVERIAPLVDKHEITHQQTAGAMSLGKWLVGISGGAMGAGIALLVQRFTGGSPHP